MSSRVGVGRDVRHRAASAASIARKRRSNLALAPRSAAFGIDVDMAREIGDREQEIADLVLDRAARAGLPSASRTSRSSSSILADDLARRPASRSRRSRPSRVSFTARVRAGRPAGTPASRPAAAGSSGCPPRLAPRALGLLGCLDLAPERLDAVGREVARVAEHVRMAADQLARDAPRPRRRNRTRRPPRPSGHGTRPGAEGRRVRPCRSRRSPRCDRVGDLIGFLDRVGRDGREILLEVPRAARARRAQRRHDREQALDVAGRNAFDLPEGCQ